MTQRILLTAIAIALLAGTITLAEEVQSIDDMAEHLAEVCEAEITSYCSQVTPGEGRLLECLEKNDKKVSGRCKQAMKDVEVEKQ